MPQVNRPDTLSLNNLEEAVLQGVHQRYDTVIIEKEFEGGFSGTRVFLILPVKPDHTSDARVVTKLGPAEELRRELENYETHVARALPFSVAQVRDFYEQDGLAGLNYIFAGGETLGQTVSLEDYYQTRSASAIIATLEGLLDKSLGSRWYRGIGQLNRPFREEYGRHLPEAARLIAIVKGLFPSKSLLDSPLLQLPGITEIYPNPLHLYPKFLDKSLEGQRSLVHGDLHLRNILVDENGKGWLIDFAKVKERHNLFDFVKLETYLRLWTLAADYGSYSWNDYLQFEKALSNATTGVPSSLPANASLSKAYQIILAIRTIARRYMGGPSSFQQEYLPALFLYCLAVMKYVDSNGPSSTQLLFLSACVIGEALSGKSSLTKTQIEPERPQSNSLSAQAPTSSHPEGDQPHTEPQQGITVGNISNATGIAIGHKAQTTVNIASTGHSGDPIKDAFALLFRDLERMAESKLKDDALLALTRLEDEAKQGERADGDQVKIWLLLLKSKSETTWRAALATLSEPIPGIGRAFTTAVQQAKDQATGAG